MLLKLVVLMAVAVLVTLIALREQLINQENWIAGQNMVLPSNSSAPMNITNMTNVDSQRATFPSYKFIHLIINHQKNANNQDAIELCSVYSMANIHPDRVVFVHTHQKLPEAHLWSNLSNVFVNYINDSTICADTPVESFYQKFITDLIFKSNSGAIKLTDILRSCIIYKYGGTYTDTDVIQLKTFGNATDKNFVILVADGRVGTSVFNFEKGNQNLHNILAKMEESYQPNVWSSIGPALFHRELYGKADVIKMPNDFVSPFIWSSSPELMLNPQNAESTKQKVTQKGSVALHVFRAAIQWTNITEYSSESYLAKLIKDRCPPIYENKLVCCKPNNSDCHLQFQSKQSA